MKTRTYLIRATVAMPDDALIEKGVIKLRDRVTGRTRIIEPFVTFADTDPEGDILLLLDQRDCDIEVTAQSYTATQE